MPATNIGGFPRISPQAYIGATIALTAVATSIALYRLILSVRRYRALEFHDYFLMIAVVTLIGSSAFSVAVSEQFYYQIYFAYGLAPIRGSDPLGTVVAYLKMSNALTIIQWISIFSIKFSYVAFFRRLIDGIKSLQILWYLVLLLLTGSLGAVLTSGLIICSATKEEIIIKCNGDAVYRRQSIYFIVTVTVDVLTDILIISIPATLLWRVRIRLSRKAALASILCLSSVMIIIAVLRVALSKLPGSLLAPSGVTDTVWVFFWQGVEAAVAIIMVSLTTFRSIFGQESRERSNRRSANNSFGSRISAAKFALLNKSPGQTTSSFTTQHSNPDRPVSLISAPPPQMQETNLAIGPSVINSRRLTPHFTSSPPQPMFPLSPPMLPPTVYRPMSSSNAVSPEDYHLPATTYRPGFSRPGTAHRRSSLSFKRRHSRHPSRSSQNQQILSSSAFSPTMTGTTLAPSNPTSPSAHALPPIRSPLSSPRKQNWTNPTALARVGELESRALEWQRNGRFVEGNPNLLNQITEVRSPRSGASTPKLTVARRGDGDEGKIQWKIVEKLGDD